MYIHSWQIRVQHPQNGIVGVDPSPCKKVRQNRCQAAWHIGVGHNRQSNVLMKMAADRRGGSHYLAASSCQGPTGGGNTAFAMLWQPVEKVMMLWQAELLWAAVS